MPNDLAQARNQFAMTHRHIYEMLEVALSNADSSHTILSETVRILAANCPTYNWTGFYMVEAGELVLGPFAGAPTPHTRIKLGEGICGAAATAKETVIVDDVNADPRYLACSIETKSEIVVPLMDGDICIGEIDIDSHQRAAFGKDDALFLEKVAALVVMRLNDLKRVSQGARHR